MNPSIEIAASARDRRRSTRIIVIVNTIVCALAIFPSFALQLATVMGGAAPGAGRLGTFIATVGLVLPTVPVISIIGSWITLRWRRITLTFVALPWLFWAVLGAALVIFFTR
ncbi:MAG TPA: hypothetical protein VF660_11330 [Actinomycetota bacterium]|jgi:hypothetical protein